MNLARLRQNKTILTSNDTLFGNQTKSFLNSTTINSPKTKTSTVRLLDQGKDQRRKSSYRQSTTQTIVNNDQAISFRQEYNNTGDSVVIESFVDSKMQLSGLSPLSADHSSNMNINLLQKQVVLSCESPESSNNKPRTGLSTILEQNRGEVFQFSQPNQQLRVV